MRIRKPRKTFEQKIEIYDVYNKGELTIEKMVEKFRVSTATIYKIVRELDHE
jgi:Mor family transcriptional regulator